MVVSFAVKVNNQFFLPGNQTWRLFSKTPGKVEEIKKPANMLCRYQ